MLFRSANLLIDLSKNREQIRDVGLAAKNLLSESFSVEVMAKKYIETYKELMVSK